LGKSSRLVKEETTTTGGVPLRVYRHYLGNMFSPLVAIIVIVLLLAISPLRAAGDEWCVRLLSCSRRRSYGDVATATSHTHTQTHPVLRAVTRRAVRCWNRFGEFSSSRSSMTVNEFVGEYCAFMGAHLIAVIARSLIWAKGSVVAATHVHNAAISRLIRCPTSFFEST
jgi:hypothetical protein